MSIQWREGRKGVRKGRGGQCVRERERQTDRQTDRERDKREVRQVCISLRQKVDSGVEKNKSKSG